MGQRRAAVEGPAAGRGRLPLPARERHDFVDKMITFAVHSARAEAIEFKVTPETTAGVTGTGFPFAWAIAWRVRSASWMLTHRSRLQRAIG